MTETGGNPSMVVTPLPGGPLGQALSEVLVALATRTASDGADPVVSVLDCGGGSGTLAVPIAARGARVTVVDSSIDALAILERRAQEAGVSQRIQAVQGDVENLAELVAPGSVDLVLLHGVLTSVTDGGPVMSAAAAAARPGGYLSVAVANSAASVLSRALSGDLSGALAELSAADAAVDLPWLIGLAESLGLTVVRAQGLGAFSGLVPGAFTNSARRSDDIVTELDRRAATRSPYRDIAARLHLLAQRPISAIS